MSNSTFLSKQNISMLWDVISDEDLFKYLTKENQHNIINIFSDNLKNFYEAEIKNKSSLIDMNKKYVLITLNIIKQNYQGKQPNKIKILEEISPNSQKNLITYEEIQNEKKSQFEKDLNKRKEELTNFMSISVPPVPEFKDNYDNYPITEMEKLIKEMTEQRNYDVEQINRTTTVTNTDNWLKPQETSIKNDKQLIKERKDLKNVTSNLEQKNVTWGNNEIINSEISEISDKLFGKLKKKQNNESNIEIKQSIALMISRIDKISEEINQMREYLQKIT
jgi:hypothetical protein